MSYFITLIIVAICLTIYDYFTYRRLAYLDDKVRILDIKYTQICRDLDKKIEDHKLETRRIA
jgi:hypothetical protein